MIYNKYKLKLNITYLLTSKLMIFLICLMVRIYCAIKCLQQDQIDNSYKLLKKIKLRFILPLIL